MRESLASPDEIEERCQEFREEFFLLKEAIGRVFVGQEKVIEEVIIALLAEGHVLLEGVPGLGKTLLVKSLGEALSVSFSRIQFTPDLMPADIIGANLLVEDEGRGRRFVFQRGPLFANLVLADEINRATPKTQSALLEAMQEGHVTVGGHTYRLEEPFFVLATQNPLDMEGTYPLPEAQMDRFFFKLKIAYPGPEDLARIIDLTTTGQSPSLGPIPAASRMLEARALAREVLLPQKVKELVVKLILATHPDLKHGVRAVERYVRLGASPRGAQCLVRAGKIKALLEGRVHVCQEDILDICLPALRHRILLNFEGETEGIDPDDIVRAVAQEVSRQRAG